MLWERAYVEIAPDGKDKGGSLWDVLELDNGDLMAVGYVTNNHKWDPLIIRTDADGCIDQGQANCPQVQIIDLMSGAVDVIGEPPISINPNPACTHITIDAPDRSVYTIYSLSGQAVVQGIAADTEVDISHLSAGIYIVKIVDMNGQIYCQKLQKH